MEQLECRTLLSGTPPVIAPNQVFNVLASSDVDSTVGTVSVTDAETDPLTYSIESGNDGAFKIDSATGKIAVANKSLLNSLAPTTTLRIKVVEGKAPVNTVEADITVKLNHAPKIDDATFIVPSPVVDNQVVGTRTGTDPDPGQTQTLQYFITAGNETGAFAIDNTTGTITIASKSAFDQLSTPKRLTVEARDIVDGTGQGKDSAVITVTEDGPPVAGGKVVFSFSQNSAVIDASKPTSVGRLDPKALFSLAPDVDDNFDGATLIASFKGVTQQLNKGKFTIVSDDPGDGRISVVGKSILFGDKVIGAFHRGPHHNLVITLNETARANSIQSLVRRIGFASRGPEGPRQITLAFSGVPDLPGISFSRTKTVYVNT